MTENNTDAARIYRAVIVKRMPEHYGWLQPQVGTFVPTSDHSEFESAMGTWVANLQRAKEQDFFMMWREGKIANAATVLGAEQVPARFYGSGGLTKPEVRWITSLSVPAWLESLLDQPFDMPNRNPVYYVEIHHDPVTGAVKIVK